jgi:hypothetical protein
LSTTLSTGMAGISLHMQTVEWKFSQREQLLLSEAQPKNTLVPPPPIWKQTQKYMRLRARVAHTVTFLQYARAQFYIFYNFITFKLRSTTERMPALVSLRIKLHALIRLGASPPS